jgi:hypothetical protein
VDTVTSPSYPGGAGDLAALEHYIDVSDDPVSRDLAERTRQRLLAHLPGGQGGTGPRPVGGPRRAGAARVFGRTIVQQLDRLDFPNTLTLLRDLPEDDFRALLGDLIAVLVEGGRGADDVRLVVDRMGAVVREWHTGTDRAVLARLPDGLIEAPGPVAVAVTFVDPGELVAAYLGRMTQSKSGLEALHAASGLLGRIDLTVGERFDPRLRELVRRLAPPAPVRYDDVPRGVEPADNFDPNDPPMTAGEPSPIGARTAYPLLDAPTQVKPKVPFEFRVGLSDAAVQGVVAGEPLTLPAGDVDVAVSLSVGGFQVLGGAPLTFTLQVRALDPFPVQVLRLVALDTADLAVERTLQASFHIGGQLIGIAFRRVVVGTPAENAEQAVAAVTAWSLEPDPANGVDLYLIAGTANTVRQDVLSWTVVSPHDSVPQPAGVELSIGTKDEEWVRSKFAAIDKREQDLRLFLKDMGRTIRDAMPAAVWEALRCAAEATAPKPPTVLLGTNEAFIPWELAQVPDDWPTAGGHVLGGHVTIGRWLVDAARDQKEMPPASIEASTMSAVAGTYAGRDLPEARAEAEWLTGHCAATRVEAARPDVLALLRSDPAPDVLHFAVHGSFGLYENRNGILLTDTKYLTPSEVGGLDGPGSRLVFLNACQVGQGDEGLGTFTGMVPSFLRVGARAAVAPLWKVDDAEARRVGTGFYHAVLAEGISPAEYFRRQRAESTGREDTPFGTRLAYLYFGHPALRVTWHGPVPPVPVEVPA